MVDGFTDFAAAVLDLGYLVTLMRTEHETGRANHPTIKVQVPVALVAVALEYA